MQQIPFMDLFKSAVRVSSDKLAHPQEHFWLYLQLLVQWTDIAADSGKVEMELIGSISTFYTDTAADRWQDWDGTD